MIVFFRSVFGRYRACAAKRQSSIQRPSTAKLVSELTDEGQALPSDKRLRNIKSCNHTPSPNRPGVGARQLQSARHVFSRISTMCSFVRQLIEWSMYWTGQTSPRPVGGVAGIERSGEGTHHCGCTSPQQQTGGQHRRTATVYSSMRHPIGLTHRLRSIRGVLR